MTDDAEMVAKGESGNRRALVHAAYARIASGGFEGLRTRDVAALLGAATGTSALVAIGYRRRRRPR